VGPGAVLTVAEDLAPTGIRSPDRLARSESLYRHRFAIIHIYIYIYIYTHTPHTHTHTQ